MATPAEQGLESPTVRRVGAAASIERDAAAAQAGTMAIMISKDENKGGELARIPRAARKKRVSGVDILSLVAGSPSPETRGTYRGTFLVGDNTR